MFYLSTGLNFEAEFTCGIFFNITTMNYYFNSDLLRFVLRGREPLPAVPHLHRDGGQDVHQQEEERSPASHLLHRRRRLPEHAAT